MQYALSQAYNGTAKIFTFLLCNQMIFTVNHLDLLTNWIYRGSIGSEALDRSYQLIFQVFLFLVLNVFSESRKLEIIVINIYYCTLWTVHTCNSCTWLLTCILLSFSHLKCSLPFSLVNNSGILCITKVLWMFKA